MPVHSSTPPAPNRRVALFPPPVHLAKTGCQHFPIVFGPSAGELLTVGGQRPPSSHSLSKMAQWSHGCHPPMRCTAIFSCESGSLRKNGTLVAGLCRRGDRRRLQVAGTPPPQHRLGDDSSGTGRLGRRPGPLGRGRGLWPGRHDSLHAQTVALSLPVLLVELQAQSGTSISAWAAMAQGRTPEGFLLYLSPSLAHLAPGPWEEKTQLSNAGWLCRFPQRWT